MGIGDLFNKGGVTMWPLLLLSILTVTVIFERSRFWFNVLNKEKEIVNRILDATRRDWDMATEIARQAYDQPVGRFLLQALQLPSPDPDLFRLALESSADDEIAGMRRGDKILEAVIAMAPLLGLLGTVLGLIRTLGAITFTALGTEAGKDAAGGIGESLISTAAGIIVALVALSFYRIFQGLVFNQAKVFRRAGNEVELLYRQKWQYKKNDDRNVPSLDRYESNSDDEKRTF
ncbi:MAG: MotA/TolQ/ExbB proton channel family protein [Cyanobacteria bacterium]|nr:MotA/TolQ/ExbB proton channel family protein [Cyanobacteriota bacterium]